MSFQCPDCPYSAEKLISLSVHYRKTHKKSAKDLYVALFCGGQVPVCKCGCGSEVKFHNISLGFSEFKWGHGAKVHNNWGHNPVAKKKSDESRKISHAAGGWKVWNEGKTKDDDPRIAAYGQKQRMSETTKRRKRKSEVMEQQRLDGNLVPQCGPDHPGWKGGHTAVGIMARNALYERWTFPRLKEGGFKCSRCGSTKDLHVHHDKMKFAEILHLIVPEEGDPTFEEKCMLAEQVAQYHVDHNVCGIVLCTECHGLEHPSLNF